MIKNIFDKNVTQELIERINRLRQDTTPEWGKMDVGQMLAHCCVMYEFIYENNHPKIGGFKRFLLKLLVKNAVVNQKPYKKNSPTAPEFLIKSNRDFQTEKQRLIAYLIRTQELGESHFDNKEYRSFGRMTSKEWNNMFYKHLDHHLHQFRV